MEYMARFMLLVSGALWDCELNSPPAKHNRETEMLLIELININFRRYLNTERRVIA